MADEARGKRVQNLEIWPQYVLLTHLAQHGKFTNRIDRHLLTETI